MYQMLIQYIAAFFSETNLSADLSSWLQFLRCKYMSIDNIVYVRKIDQIFTIPVKKTSHYQKP